MVGQRYRCSFLILVQIEPLARPYRDSRQRPNYKEGPTPYSQTHSVKALSKTPIVLSMRSSKATEDNTLVVQRRLMAVVSTIQRLRLSTIRIAV